MKSIRVFIACADERLRLALILLLDHQPDMVVVGITDRLTRLVAQMEASEPDALLLDWELPDRSLTDLISELQDLKCRPKIIVLSARPQEKETIMAAGAYHFIPKDAPPDELLPVLNDIRLSKSTPGPS